MHPYLIFGYSSGLDEQKRRFCPRHRFGNERDDVIPEAVAAGSADEIHQAHGSGFLANHKKLSFRARLRSGHDCAGADEIVSAQERQRLRQRPAHAGIDEREGREIVVNREGCW